jgi:surface protein
MIATNGKKACVIMDGDKVVTKILVLQPVYELEGDLLLKFAVDVKKGTTLFLIDNSTEVTANDDYKAGDYLYFEKGTFKSKVFRFYLYTDYSADYYSEVRFLKGFDTSQWTGTSNLIGGYANKIVGLSKATLIDYTSLDTSHLTKMSKMFIGCTSLKSVDLSNMDTSSATDLWGFFLQCTSLTAVDVSGFDTSKVTDMGYMFRDCSSLTSLNVSNFDTKNVTDMRNMFSSCSSLTSLDVSNFGTSKVTDMGSMFNNCSSLTSLDVSNFDTSKVTDTYKMFYNCSSLTTLDVSNFDTSKVTNMGYMFYGCSSLTTLDVSNFDTSKVTSMYCVFYNCSSLTTLDVSNFDTSKVTDMRQMFTGCSSLTNLLFGSKWGTQTSTAANALTLDLSNLGSSKSYKLTDATYNSMLTMYDRATAGLTTMTIKFSKKHNLPDGFAEKMSALGYTITLV